MRILELGLAAALLAAAQQTVAPTPERAGTPRGDNIDGCNAVNWFEAGYRFHAVGGDDARYRSDVNYRNGVRLLSSYLTLHSKEGQGGLFDEIALSTQGLGNDPYQFSSLRIQKNKLYRYDFVWRLNEYYNPALAISRGRHFTDTSRRWQDHDFTLLPQSRFRLFLGYSRNKQDGPSFATVQQFDPLGDEFPLFANVRRGRNEYRLGGQLGFGAFRLNFLRGWEYFKEDTASPAGGGPGANPEDLTALSSFRRDEPYHGSSPYWRVNLFTEGRNWYTVNGRFSHATSRRNFLFDELAAGTDRFGDARNRQVLVTGDGRRPVTTASLTLSLFPAGRVTVSNHTGFHHTRMEGDSAYREVNNATLRGTLLFFRCLGIRTFTNTTDLTLRASKQVAFYGGYHYSTRRIRSVEQIAVRDILERLPGEQENRVHSGLAGVRFQPAKPLTIRLDGEIGRADRTFFPIGEKNYHALGARVQYKAKSIFLSAAAHSNYNFNSAALASHSSESRNYSFDGSWTPAGWLAVDAGYSKLHLDTLSGIAYFAAFHLVEGDRSIYVSNLHAANLGARIGLKNRASLYFGYSHVEDTGDGRRTAESGGGAELPAFLIAQTFPVAYRSPLARLSVRLHTNLRWNFGYQYYGYREDFLPRLGYRAHTGYTSVLWSF